MSLVVTAISFLLGLMFLYGWIYLMAIRPRLARLIFYAVGFPLAAFWAYGGWVITRDFGAAGYGLLVVGVLLLICLVVLFIDEYVGQPLRRHNTH